MCLLGTILEKTYSRAIFTRILSDGKLFSTFPWVCDPKNRKPEIAIVKHVMRETPVE